MLPTISIIIPVYNGEKTILQTLACALAQTYQNFDVIVVNDGSTDNTPYILNQIKDPKLKIINLSPNQGRSNARNTGVQASESDFIAFLDADDSIPSEKLQKQIDYMLIEKIDLCGTWGTAIDKNLQTVIYKQPIHDFEIKNRILKSHTFIHSSVICKRKLFLNAGGYDTKLNFSEDYDLFLKIVPLCKTGNFPSALVTYQLPSGIKYAIKEQLSIAKIRWRAISKYHYSIKYLPFVMTPLISLFVPRKFKLYLKKIIN